MYVCMYIYIYIYVDASVCVCVRACVITECIGVNTGYISASVTQNEWILIVYQQASMIYIYIYIYIFSAYWY